MIFAKNFARNFEKKNKSWNIRPLVAGSFVQRTSIQAYYIIDWRICTIRIKTIQRIQNYFFRIFWKKNHFILCNFLVRTLQYLKKNSKFFLPRKSWIKYTQKLLRKSHTHFFPLTAWAAQTVQTEKFMIQNVAYKPTVYRTGIFSLYIKADEAILE